MGVYINVGIPDDKTKFKIDSGWAIRNQSTIAGSIVGSIADTQECVEFSANYGVKPIVETFSFGDFDKAFEKAEQGKAKFRCVVNVKDWAKENGFDK